MWRCEGAEKGRFSGFYYSYVRVMSGKAYIRHILSIYSAYIAIRWKTGGREVALPFYMPISNRRKCQESFFGRLSEAGDEGESDKLSDAKEESSEGVMSSASMARRTEARSLPRASMLYSRLLSVYEPINELLKTVLLIVHKNA